MNISLCIATFNEETFLHYPLDSCIDWVDEVVIVDGNSTDKTVEVAKSYGKKVRIIQAENVPMFHANKQKAIEAAKGDWILQLDADEEVTQNLKDEILRITNDELRMTNQAVAYWVPRKNYFLGRFLTKGGVYPDHTIRLYKNGVAKFPCKTVHENVEITRAARTSAVNIGYLKNDLLHYADPNFSRYLRRWKRYNELDAKLLREKGKKPNIFNYLIIKPLTTFFAMFVRHKGFMDGWQGFVFAFFSSVRFWDIMRRF